MDENFLSVHSLNKLNINFNISKLVELSKKIKHCSGSQCFKNVVFCTCTLCSVN